MPIGIIGGIGALVGGIGSLTGGSDVKSANNQAAALQAGEYLDIKGLLSPYYTTGLTSQNRLADYFGTGPNTTDPAYGQYLKPISSVVGPPPSPNDPSLTTSFHASPGYSYTVGQASDAVTNSAAGKTGAISGNALTAISKDTAGYADTDFWNYYNALVANYNSRYGDTSQNRNQVISGLNYLGGSGQSAANETGAFGQAAATNIGNYGVAGSTAGAAGTQGFVNSLGPAANSFSSLYGSGSGGYGAQMPVGGYSYDPTYGGYGGVYNSTGGGGYDYGGGYAY